MQFKYKNEQQLYAVINNVECYVAIRHGRFYKGVIEYAVEFEGQEYIVPESALSETKTTSSETLNKQPNKDEAPKKKKK